MSGKGNKAFTKEEELLLQDFSRNVSTKSSALFYGNAFIVSAIPICEYLAFVSNISGPLLITNTVVFIQEKMQLQVKVSTYLSC